MTVDVQNDERLDPRLKAFLAMLPVEEANDVKNREEILEQLASPAGKAAVEMTVAVTDLWGSEEFAPSTGLRFETLDITSQPDGNTIKLQIVRPDDAEAFTRPDDEIDLREQRCSVRFEAVADL